MNNVIGIIIVTVGCIIIACGYIFVIPHLY